MTPSAALTRLWPWCARCRRPVEKITACEGKDHVYHFRADCHGSHERVTFPATVVECVDPVTVGWAFLHDAVRIAGNPDGAVEHSADGGESRRWWGKDPLDTGRGDG